MQWFTRFILGLPPRPQDVKELREAAPELFSKDVLETSFHRDHFYLHPVLWDSRDFTHAVRQWAQEAGEFPPETRSEEPCESPFCPRRESSLNGADSSHSVMEMMVVGGGKKSNPPAKSFFDLINATKKKKSIVRRVIMTDPYIYADIGQSGATGGFSNLIKLLQHLNINQEQTFELQLTPRASKEKRGELQAMLGAEFPNCTISSHDPDSTFHDRFVLVEYDDGDSRAWYGPSLNGLNSDSVVIFGDVTEPSALKQLSSKLSG